MKILFVVQAFRPSRGGVQHLVEQIARRVDRHHTTQVFTTNALRCQMFSEEGHQPLPAGDEEVGGLAVRRFAVDTRWPTLRRRLAVTTARFHLPGAELARLRHFGPLVPGLRSAIADFGADVIVTSSFPMLHVWDALAAGRRTATPTVLIGALHPEDRWGYGMRRLTRAAQSATRYVALTEGEREHLVNRGVEAENIEVIGAGVDVARYASEATRQRAEELRREHGWGTHPLVLVLGRQTQYKNADRVLRAMLPIWRQHPSTHLVVAGARGDATDGLERQARLFADQDQGNVTVLTDLEEVSKEALCHASDVLVQPSVRESFGLVLLEGWAGGSPVVAPDDGPAGELIDHEQDGLLVKGPSDADWTVALQRLLGDPDLRRRLGEAGLGKVQQRYDWEVVARRHLQLYEGLQ